MPEPPFRWDLVTPDQLGSLRPDAAEPDLWFRDDLVGCAGKVLARSGHGDLMFVGRSLDSMYDFLGGALAGTADGTSLARLPLSFARDPVRLGSGRWWTPPLSAGQRAAAREILAGAGVTPDRLARRSRPVAFVDVVSRGGTFTQLFELLDDWIGETREPWDVVRRKLRFVGVTVRRPTSPKTWRWQQHAGWTRRLPSGAVVNVSLDAEVWAYFGNYQTKLTRSYRPDAWTVPGDGPGRDRPRRDALAEAVALVAYGRSADGRRALAHAFGGEPARSEGWLRSLEAQLARAR